MYIGRLISDIIRPKTGNNSYTVDTDTGITVEGISQNLVLSFFNDALKFVQSQIISVYPDEFIEEDIIDLVAEQEEYAVTGNMFLNNKIISVEYSRSGNVKDYYPLPQAGLQQRDTSPGNPYQYIRRSGKLLINRIPSSSFGKIRVNFYEALDKLNIRRGQITSKTATTIVLDNDTWLDSVELDNAQYICIVDAYGVVQDYNVVVSSYDSTTRTITIPSQTLTGVAGNYIVSGKYSTTHLDPELGDSLIEKLETYCKLYTQARMYNTDSSTDEINEKTEVKDALTDILMQFSDMNTDILDVPIVDKLLT